MSTPQHYSRGCASPLRPADRLASATLYLCTDARRERGDLAEFADAALAGGVDIIQLRDKGSSGSSSSDRWRRATSSLRSRCSPTPRAATTRCWRSTTGPISPAPPAPTCCISARTTCRCRSRATSSGRRPLIGRSTHDRDQAAAADAEAVDYFCVGPCWPTPTKPGRPAPGLDLVRATTASAGTDKPWFAIGGIDEERLPEVLDAGARRIVVVRAITVGRRSARSGAAGSKLGLQQRDSRRDRAKLVPSWPRTRDAAATPPRRPRPPSAIRHSPGWARSRALRRRRRSRSCRSIVVRSPSRRR